MIFHIIILCVEDQVIVKKEKMDVTLHEHDQFSIKGTNSVGVQFNYMIPSMGKFN